MRVLLYYKTLIYKSLYHDKPSKIDDEVILISVKSSSDILPRWESWCAEQQRELDSDYKEEMEIYERREKSKIFKINEKPEKKRIEFQLYKYMPECNKPHF